MDPSTNPSTADHDPTTEEIDEKYSAVDPEDVSENAIDYFSGGPETESEKAEDREETD